MATCRKSVECLENFLRAESGDPKTLKGECGHRHITFIMLNHDCTCMKISRFVRFCINLVLQPIIKSRALNTAHNIVGSFCNLLGRIQQNTVRFVRRFVGF